MPLSFINKTLKSSEKIFSVDEIVQLDEDAVYKNTNSEDERHYFAVIKNEYSHCSRSKLKTLYCIIYKDSSIWFFSEDEMKTARNCSLKKTNYELKVVLREKSHES